MLANVGAYNRHFRRSRRRISKVCCGRVTLRDAGGVCQSALHLILYGARPAFALHRGKQVTAFEGCA